MFRSVGITVLKDELVRFELTGPHSHTILNSVLRLSSNDSKGDGALDSAAIWRALGQLRTPASLPSGAVLAITVDDPRYTFPPQSINKVMRARDQIHDPHAFTHQVLFTLKSSGDSEGDFACRGTR